MTNKKVRAAVTKVLRENGFTYFNDDRKTHRRYKVREGVVSKKVAAKLKAVSDAVKVEDHVWKKWGRPEYECYECTVVRVYDF